MFSRFMPLHTQPTTMASSISWITLFFTLVQAVYVPPENPCEYSWITQKVDHFGRNNGTFQQRYSISTSHFKPGGPIHFFQGEETNSLDCAVCIRIKNRMRGLDEVNP